jgi:DNA (cytosine-5)-methyltransferase 1
MLSKFLQAQRERSGMHTRDYPEAKLGTCMAARLTVGFFLRRNSPDTTVYNQCVNELLRYAIKSCRGVLEEDEVPKDIYDNSKLPRPPQPGDIDVIIAGFPWCVPTSLISPSDTQGEPVSQPHSQLNMFQKANDVKSNLILNLLSWVDFLQPKYCVFENVRGFLSYNLNAIQVDEHRTTGGISMGGLKFLVHAMLAMKYVMLPLL